ncbi:MAG: family 43 glycosylhydrolase [Oscillospiraceae bacterium]|nr:family 43 glycosylhydrolase [Oscillospiraceae bacterium]
MKQQVFNPYLPSWEYVPDGEPHVFGDRVYVYGSHDAFGAPIFCVNDYVCWSAPVDDLSDWRYEGVIYRKRQDPGNPLGIRSLYAPDVTRGPDGRYYLYYCFDFLGEMGVAVCDTPAGAYQFYGKVHFPDGHVWGKRNGEPFPFDPGVLTDDDGRVYVYSGFATKVPFPASRWHNLTNEGGVVLELERDMVTIKAGPELLFPVRGRQGAFPDHAFFEASSIRKVDGKYCFVYSSEHNHDLCYAMGDSPRGPFTYGGVLVDLGDLYLDGRADERHAANYLGNTHGGLLNIGEDWYIFYHRQTNRSSYARQACAERLTRTPDGGFAQSELTSCGLNGGPLRGIGKYEARIACNLWSKDGTGRYDVPRPKKRFAAHPYFTQSGKDREGQGDQYIANMRDGAVAGFKYFEMEGACGIGIDLRGTASGVMQVSERPDFSVMNASIAVEQRSATVSYSGRLCIEPGEKALYFRFLGAGAVDFLSFTLEESD